jgi:hypothetical protein
MDWIYNFKPFEPPADAVGFVYCIYRNDTCKTYIGKKTLVKSITRPPLKGKTRKRRSKVESDWRTYWGSNKPLQDEVAELGEDKFTRQVLRVCYSKSEMSYYEAKYQFEYDVLLKPEEFYNEWISVKTTRSHLRKLKAED